MPDVVFAILEAIVRLGGGDRVPSIAEVSGYSTNYFYRCNARMMRHHWIEKIAGHWTITERGKLVLAIETGRRTKRRAQAGQRRCAPSFISFVRASLPLR